MRANEIHAQLGGSWPAVLVQLGIPETALRNKHGPCPGCGGKDCFRFDNKQARGTFLCSKGTGAGGGVLSGDGFALLMHVHGWNFQEARRRVIDVAGLRGSLETSAAAAPPKPLEERAAAPTEYVHRLRRDVCPVERCDDVVDYLASRGLWPLPEGCTLKAHASAEYWDEGKRTGRYPALVAEVRDISDELVTLHVTYIQGGKKLEVSSPRKILTKMTGREGCAARLMPAGEVLGIAEGIETALSAALLDGVPVWAALNTSLLSKFEPPPNVTRLVLYADRDEAGLIAAARLAERLQGRLRFEVRIPPTPAKDWNDVLMAHQKDHS